MPLNYPLRVIFYGGYDMDGFERDTYEVYGPFAKPGALWRWANDNGYLSAYRGWRDEINALIAERRGAGLCAVEGALDEWAAGDLREGESIDGIRADVIEGGAAWREWKQSQEEDLSEYSHPPEGWHAAGPVQSCGCEDWPCCAHADDYIYAR